MQPVGYLKPRRAIRATVFQRISGVRPNWLNPIRVLDAPKRVAWAAVATVHRLAPDRSEDTQDDEQAVQSLQCRQSYFCTLEKEMNRLSLWQLVVAVALTTAVSAGAQTTTAPAKDSAMAATTDAASTQAQKATTKASTTRAKATAKSRSNPTVCAHLPPDDRKGCEAKAKSNSTAALTKSASGAGGAGGGGLPKTP
jgi:hypothetical protein